MKKQRRDRRYYLRLFGLAFFAVLIPVLVVPMGVGAVTMWKLTHPACGGDGKTPADFNLPFQDVNIPSHLGGTYRGFFIPGTKGATIIVPPVYGANRAGMLTEGSILGQDGYNVLLFDSRICAGKEVISLGYNEVDDVGDALDYLKQNTDNIHVDMSKIALHGFSSAGATVLMSGARYPEIAAVLAEGNYHNMNAYLGTGNNGDSNRSFFETLIVWGAQIAYRVGTGQDSSVLDPLGAVAKIPPRPLFLIHGTSEPSFYGGGLEYAAALAAQPTANTHFWKVPNSGHGGYIATAGIDEYKRHVLPFYACALLNQCDAWNALWQ